MKTFLKVLLFLVALYVLFHVWPAALAVLAAATLAFVLFGGLVAGGIALLVGALLLAVLLVAAVLIALLGVSSPIWIPVLLIVGIVALVRRDRPAKRAL